MEKQIEELQLDLENYQQENYKLETKIGLVQAQYKKAENHTINSARVNHERAESRLIASLGQMTGQIEQHKAKEQEMTDIIEK